MGGRAPSPSVFRVFDITLLLMSRLLTPAPPLPALAEIILPSLFDAVVESRVESVEAAQRKPTWGSVSSWFVHVTALEAVVLFVYHSKAAPVTVIHCFNMYIRDCLEQFSPSCHGHRTGGILMKLVGLSSPNHTEAPYSAPGITSFPSPAPCRRQVGHS